MLEQVEIPEHTREKLREDAKAVKISVLKKGMSELEQLYIDQQEAAEHFAACVKAVAEKSGLKPAVIRKVVKEKCDSKLNEAKHEAEQLSMAFEWLEAGSRAEAWPEV